MKFGNLASNKKRQELLIVGFLLLRMQSKLAKTEERNEFTML